MRAAMAQFKKMVSNGQFVPPSVGKDTVSFPGMDGGAEWGGSAFDPDTGLLYVNSNEMVWLYALAENPKPGTAVSGKDLYNRECASCHREDRTGAPPAIPSLVDIGKRMTVAEVRAVVFYGSGRMPGFPTLAPDYTNAIVSYVRDGVESSVPIPADAKPVPWDTQYRFTGHHKFLDIDGYPAITPPWGTLNAINMNTGEYAWKIPLGEYPELVAKGLTNTGSENYGGPIVTAGGLVFIAATNYDKKFRAFDKRPASSSGKRRFRSRETRRRQPTRSTGVSTSSSPPAVPEERRPSATRPPNPVGDTSRLRSLAARSERAQTDDRRETRETMMVLQFRKIAATTLSAIAFFWLTSALAFAQTTGTVTGTVKDDQGGVIPGATVTLVSEARGTSLEAVTTVTGDFVFSNITGDTYLVRVSMDGFKTVERRGIAVSPGDRVVVPAFNLQVGALAETVLVTGDAPMIQSQTGERSFTVAQTQVENLPNTGRNFASFAALVPGVVGTTVSAGGNAGISRLGGGTTNFLLDGVSNVDPGGNGQGIQLNMDAIAEVKVLSSAYQAEYGRSSGLQISGVTKSGTNQFHGSFFDIERNRNGIPTPGRMSRTALRSL